MLARESTFDAAHRARIEAETAVVRIAEHDHRLDPGLAAIGEPVETNEAKPLWTPLGSIPFPRMWADDALWLPLLLERKHFKGRFVFDGDRMLDYELQSVPG